MFLLQKSVKIVNPIPTPIDSQHFFLFFKLCLLFPECCPTGSLPLLHHPPPSCSIFASWLSLAGQSVGQRSEQAIFHMPEKSKNFFSHQRHIMLFTLQRKSHLCVPFLGIARPQPQFPHSCVCVRFM